MSTISGPVFTGEAEQVHPGNSDHSSRETRVPGGGYQFPQQQVAHGGRH